jgi:hypothetical protein
MEIKRGKEREGKRQRRERDEASIKEHVREHVKRTH